MEELDLKDLFSYYLKKLPIIVLCTLLAILVAYFYVEYMQVPMYSASTTIILVQKESSSNIEESKAATQSSLSLNETLVTTYSEIIKSRKVLSQVIKELDLNTTSDGLASQITVTPVTDTPIITLTVVDLTNKEAVLIANKVAEVFQTEISDIYNLENVSVIDAAIEDEYPVPYNINSSKTYMIFTSVGLVAACAIIFIMYYFDNSIKGKKEIEKNLDMVVLAEIPVAKKIIERKLKDEKKKNKNKNTKEIEYVIPPIASEKKDSLSEQTDKPATKPTTRKKTTSKSTKKTSSTRSTKSTKALKENKTLTVKEGETV